MKTWFNQAGRKKSRRIAREKKATELQKDVLRKAKEDMSLGD